jgi:hypothetical protein
MNNPLDKFNLTRVNQASPVQYNPIYTLQNMMQNAMQNPKAFEEQFKQSNPQAYQKALQIRNGFNPQQSVLQLAQSKGITPDMLRRMGFM